MGHTHNPDGTLKAGTPSFDPKITSISANANQAITSAINNQNSQNNNGGSSQQQNPPIMGFTANDSKTKNQLGQSSDTFLFVSSTRARSSAVGPIAHDGAP